MGEEHDYIKRYESSGASKPLSDEIDPSKIGSRKAAKSINAEQISSIKFASAFSGADGGTQIQNAIDEAESEAGPNVVIVDGRGPDDVSGLTGAIGEADYAENAWKLTTYLSIPSNTTLLLKNCYLFLDDGVDNNIVRSADLLGTQNPNISIVGDGNSIIDGNATGQTLTTDSPERVGLRLVGVDSITLRDFTIRNTNGWGIKIEDSEDFLISNIEGDMDDSKTNQTITQNAGPLSRGTIENIYGVAGDDPVALSAESTSDMIESGGGGDVKDVTIQNIESTVLGGHRVVRLITGDGYTTRDITIDTIHSSSNMSNIVKIGWESVGISPSMGDIEGINISNVTANSNADGVYTVDPIRNVSIETVSVQSGKGVWLAEDASNVSISNIFSKTGEALHLTGIMELLNARGLHTFGSDSGPYAPKTLYIGGKVFQSSFEGIYSAYTDIAVEIGNNYKREGVTISHIMAYLESTSPGTVVQATGQLGGSDYVLMINDVQVRRAENVFDIAAGLKCIIKDVRVQDADVTTVYSSIGDAKFEGDVPPMDLTPTHVKGSHLIADGTNWDPDSDGNAEKVMSDGTAWQEIVDLPNW